MSITVRLAALLLALAPVLSAAPTTEGAEALAAARAAKQAAYELEAGEARDAALLAAAEAYFSVAGNAGFEAAPRVEAAFRAGELYRAQGVAERAGEAFGRCVELGEPSEEEELREFAARGLLEQAHLSRRAKEYAAAERGYAAVTARFGDRPRRVAQARGWRLRMFLEMEQLDEAKGVAHTLLGAWEQDPMETLEGIDRVGVALVEAGREREARELVAVLRSRLEPRLAGEEPDAERLRVALQEMRVTAALTGV